MTWLNQIVKKLNQNSIFRFISSVKLAIPLMFTLTIVVAWGTIVESHYNSDYSSLLIYKSMWFGWLLALLWINIFCSTISRIPYKKYHTGFVITHIGLMTLLIGGFITNRFGIDGQLSIQENQSGRVFMVSDLMLGYQIDGQQNIQKTVFPKMIFPQEKSGLSFINNDLEHILTVEKYLPFAKANRIYLSDPSKSEDIALSFILKSQFFNVNEWLHSRDNPEMQMGPATLRLVKVNSLESAPDSKVQIKNKIAIKKPGKITEKLVITSIKNKSDIQEIELSKLKESEVSFHGLKIQLKKKYRSAVVSENKIKENDINAPENPAVEISIKKDAEEIRDVLFAKFKDFSMRKEGLFGYRFSYFVSESPALDSAVENQPAEDKTPEIATGGPQNVRPGSRVIEFHVDPKNTREALIVLFKDQKKVLSQKIAEGEKLVTPWMGIEIFLGSLKMNAVESSSITPVNPEKRKELPSSAMFVHTKSDESFWLTEGESKNLSINNKNMSLYYGRELLELPFEVHLKKFSKLDYPGTNTPMSYESLVSMNDEPTDILISMNEPYKKDGYTLYQSSFIMNPNEAPVSIFSVNKDPGRILKYLGSLILSLGIIIFTLMKSRVGKNNKGPHKHE